MRIKSVFLHHNHIPSNLYKKCFQRNFSLIRNSIFRRPWSDFRKFYSFLFSEPFVSLPGQYDAKTSRADPGPDHEGSVKKYQEFRLGLDRPNLAQSSRLARHRLNEYIEMFVQSLPTIQLEWSDSSLNQSGSTLNRPSLCDVWSSLPGPLRVPASGGSGPLPGTTPPFLNQSPSQTSSGRLTHLPIIISALLFHLQEIQPSFLEFSILSVIPSTGWVLFPPLFIILFPEWP